MKFAKVVDGALEFAPRRIEREGKLLFTTSLDEYAVLGYRPVRLTDAPSCPEEYELSYHWENDGTACVQVWEFTEIPQPEKDAEDMRAPLQTLRYEEK